VFVFKSPNPCGSELSEIAGKKKAGMPIDPGEINHELLGTLLSVPMHGWLVI